MVRCKRYSHSFRLYKSRKAINDHCKEKGVTFRDTLTEGGMQKLKYINEGNVYRLIISSDMPQAEVFESWIFDEVLPTIRKRGYYGVYKKEDENYIDARDIPHTYVQYNGCQIKMIKIDGECWYSINDINNSIGSRTDSTQCVRRLNVKRVLTRKIRLHGSTHCAWFTNMLGIRLLLCASRKYRMSNQLMLDFNG